MKTILMFGLRHPRLPSGDNCKIPGLYDDIMKEMKTVCEHWPKISPFSFISACRGILREKWAFRFDMAHGGLYNWSIMGSPRRALQEVHS